MFVVFFFTGARRRAAALQDSVACKMLFLFFFWPGVDGPENWSAASAARGETEEHLFVTFGPVSRLHTRAHTCTFAHAGAQAGTSWGPFVCRHNAAYVEAHTASPFFVTRQDR